LLSEEHLKIQSRSQTFHPANILVAVLKVIHTGVGLGLGQRLL